MLEGEHRGRHEHSHLLAIAGCLEGSTNRHFGLAEAHITTHQSVHRTGTFHIFLHLGSCLALVGGIFVKEGSLQLMLHITIWAIGVSLFTTALGIELDQVAGYILDTLLGLVLELIPSPGAQGGETWRLAGIGTAILADFIERVDGDIHLIVVGVDDADHLLITVARRHTHQSAKLADTEIHMHDEIAGFHLLQLLHGEGHLARTGGV